MHKSRAFDDRLVCDDGRAKPTVTTSTFRKNMIQLSKRVLLALHRVLFDPHRYALKCVPILQTLTRKNLFSQSPSLPLNTPKARVLYGHEVRHLTL